MSAYPTGLLRRRGMNRRMDASRCRGGVEATTRSWRIGAEARHVIEHVDNALSSPPTEAIERLLVGRRDLLEPLG